MNSLWLKAASVLILGCVAINAQPSVGAVVNAADYSTDFAPGGLISIFGSNFAPALVTAGTIPLPTSLDGVSVTVVTSSGTFQAPLYFVSPGQINAQLPYGISGSATVTVSTSGANSTASTVKISTNAPKFFTSSEAGAGYILATHANSSLISQTSPVHPGETIILYMNSLGDVTPAIAAGAAPGNGTSTPLNAAVTKPTALLDNLAGNVTYAGLTPGYPGLYQINVTTPFDDKLGDAPISVADGSATTQASVTLPVEANGLYFVVTGGKFVNGQTLNGVSGSNSSIAFRHNNSPGFSTDGTNAWTQNTGLSSSFSNVAGLALTLKNGGNVVFDNNGIDTGTYGTYYDATAATPVGTAVLFSMSNLSSPTSSANTIQGVYAGYFKLNSSTTIDQITGYFEGPVNVDPPFDPANIYNRYRVNIYSNRSGVPGSNSYTGDVLTSDSAAGTFSYGPTGVDRIETNGIHIPIYRLVYTLKTPVTLSAGEYWFSHDVATPQNLAATTSVSDSVVRRNSLVTLRPKNVVKQ